MEASLAMFLRSCGALAICEAGCGSACERLLLCLLIGSLVPGAGLMVDEHDLVGHPIGQTVHEVVNHQPESSLELALGVVPCSLGELCFCCHMLSFCLGFTSGRCVDIYRHIYRKAGSHTV